MMFRWAVGGPVRACESMMAARYMLPDDPSPGELLLIAISVSGEVARTIEAVEIARQVGARTMAITANPQGSLASIADGSIVIDLPELPTAPGLLSYLGSLQAGYAIAAAMAPPGLGEELSRAMMQIPDLVKAWMAGEIETGTSMAQDIGPQGIVFLGSGPAAGAANFAAAKLIEASGEPAWARDVEEWAHLEYFCEPAGMCTWLLSGGGRAASREDEVETAAKMLKRHWVASRWRGDPDWPRWLGESLAPLALWVGPAAMAARRAELLGEQPFRGFGGGRDVREGGGASRIRSSRRVDLVQFDSPSKASSA